MAQGLHLSQRLTQSLVLAPQLQQSLALLQAPTLELKALVEHGVEADMTVGSSVGALNAAYFAGDPTAAGVARLEVLRRQLGPPGRECCSSVAVYAGEAFPAWRGNLLVGALAGERVARLELDADGRVVHEEAMLSALGARIRNVEVGPDGFVYLFDETAGRVLRLKPKG